MNSMKSFRHNILRRGRCDHIGRRVKKITRESEITFFYDSWNLIEERVAYAGGANATVRYYWGKDLSGTFQGAGGVGGLLYITVTTSNIEHQTPPLPTPPRNNSTFPATTTTATSPATLMPAAILSHNIHTMLSAIY